MSQENAMNGPPASQLATQVPHENAMSGPPAQAPSSPLKPRPIGEAVILKAKNPLNDLGVVEDMLQHADHLPEAIMLKGRDPILMKDFTEVESMVEKVKAIQSLDQLLTDMGPGEDVNQQIPDWWANSCASNRPEVTAVVRPLFGRPPPMLPPTNAREDDEATPNPPASQASPNPPANLATHNPVCGLPPKKATHIPQLTGFDCPGCESLACTVGWRDASNIGNGQWVGVSKAQLEAMGPEARERRAANMAEEEAKAIRWLKSHGLHYTKFLCEHASGTSTWSQLERGQGELPILKCPTCSKSKHILQPLLAAGGGRWGVIRNLQVMFLYTEGCSRKAIAEKLCIDENAVGDAFRRFDEVLATAGWHHSFALHNTALALEKVQIKIMFNGDETTYGGSKYGRGKPTCIGVTQWFQTVTLLYLVPATGKYKIGDFAVIPIADRKAHTMLANIRKTVLPGRTIFTDCHRSYYGLGANYEHLTVNHSHHFKDPVTGAHTNHIESFHRHLKDEVKAKKGGGLGQDSSGRIIRVMATTVLLRGRMSINHSTPFLAALGAIRDVCTAGADLWKPEVLDSNRVTTITTNLMGREEVEPDVPVQELVDGTAVPHNGKKTKKAKVKATAEKEITLAQTPMTQMSQLSVTAATATATTAIDSPRRPAKKVNELPMCDADWKKLTPEQTTVAKEKIAKMLEAYKQQEFWEVVGRPEAKGPIQGELTPSRRPGHKATRTLLDQETQDVDEEYEATQVADAPVTQDATQATQEEELSVKAPSNRVLALVRRVRAGGAIKLLELDDLNEQEEEYYQLMVYGRRA